MIITEPTLWQPYPWLIYLSSLPHLQSDPLKGMNSNCWGSHGRRALHLENTQVKLWTSGTKSKCLPSITNLIIIIPLVENDTENQENPHKSLLISYCAVCDCIRYRFLLLLRASPIEISIEFLLLCVIAYFLFWCWRDNFYIEEY
jgi:hypothetical protein